MLLVRFNAAIFVAIVPGFVLTACNAGAAATLPLGDQNLRNQELVAGNLPPMFVSTPPNVTPESQLFSFQASASDPDGDALSYGLLAAPLGMKATPEGLVTWQPTTGQAGFHNVVLAVRDASATVTQGWTLRVTIVPQAPAIISVPRYEAITGQLYTYRITATGSPSPTVSVSGAPSWLVFDGVDILGGTPGSTATTGPITVKASNSVAPECEQTFSIDVVTPAVPSITSIPVTSARVGEPYEYRIQITGHPAATVTVAGAPAWLNFDAATSTLSGTPPPPAGQAGPVVVEASNIWGRDIQSFSIDVMGVWTAEAVSLTGPASPGECTALGLDGSGHAHVAWQYREGEGSSLKYATNRSGQWLDEIADDEDGDCGWSASMALDSNGNARIAHGGDMGALKYTTNASGTWTSTVIAQTTTISMFFSTALALDGFGNVHIVYKHNSAIRYATNATGDWTNESIAASADGIWPSLAIDAQGQAHVVFFAINGEILRYATNASGAWVREILDDDPVDVTGRSPCVALDSNGNPHIVYCNLGRRQLFHITNASGNWVRRTLPEPRATLGRIALALDATDCLHIVHASASSRGLRYVSNVSGAWACESVADAAGNSPLLAATERIGLVVDTVGSIHVAAGETMPGLTGGYWLYYLKN